MMNLSAPPDSTLSTALALIVAGGSGRRMRHKAPKQYIHLNGRPILSWTLSAVAACKQIEALVLVVPTPDIPYCRSEILPKANINKKIKIVGGGSERQSSVFMGLQAIEEKSAIVAIHDGVRPFINPDHIDSCITEARQSGACILGLPAYDSLKTVRNHQIEHSIPRDTVWLAQTPQVFRLELIREAHAQATADGYIGTDDAALVERLGHPVSVRPGSRLNIKITDPDDLRLARSIAGIKKV